MVCRESKASSAMMTRARMETGLADVQVIGLMHKLNKSSPAQSEPDPSLQEYREFIQTQIEEVERSSGSDARKESIRRRLRETLRNQLPPDGPTFYAQQNIRVQAEFARMAQDRFFETMTDVTGMSRSSVEGIYHQRLQEGAPDGVSKKSIPAHDDYGYTPDDRDSRWAFHATRAELGLEPPVTALACSQCGQFKGRSHSCPETVSSSAHAGSAAQTSQQEPKEDVPISEDERLNRQRTEEKLARVRKMVEDGGYSDKIQAQYNELRYRDDMGASVTSVGLDLDAIVEMESDAIENSMKGRSNVRPGSIPKSTALVQGGSVNYVLPSHYSKQVRDMAEILEMGEAELTDQLHERALGIVFASSLRCKECGHIKDDDHARSSCLLS